MKDNKMRFNKIVKSLAIALPILVLSACSSTDESDAQNTVDNNAAMVEQQAKEEAERVKVAAMQKEQAIIEQKLEQNFKPDFLGGVTTVNGEILIRERKDSKNADEMYHAVEKPAMKSYKGQFVPYFTWSNRGNGEMSVWMPIIWK